MALEINNASLIFNASRSRLVIDDPYSVGEIVRVFNSSSVSQNYSYTDFYGKAQSISLSAGSVEYLLVKIGSAPDRYNSSTQIVQTRLLIYDTVLGDPFTEVLLTVPGSSTWTKPVGVTQVVVECWGGGGAGGGCQDVDSAGGGGASGQFARSLITYSSPQTNVSYTVAASVAGTINDGANGQNTSWATNQVVARGGQGGFIGAIQSIGFEGTGSLDTSGGTVVYAGRDGGQGFYSARGASVTAGQGADAPGSANLDSFGSPTTKEYGGAASLVAILSSGGQDGDPGLNYGGGGAGAVLSSGPNRSGGDGAQGLIRLIYR